MDKIICDICGTVYPQSDECCPICGCSREFSQNSEAEIPSQMPEYVPESRKKGGIFSAAQKKYHIDFYDYDEEDDYEQDEALRKEFPDISASPREHRVNVPVVIVLTVLIALSLLASVYLFFRYDLPNRSVSQPETEESSLPVTSEDATEITEDPTVPCQSIVLTAGAPELSREGQYWLLHVIVMPEDTTDQLVFFSADENVVTVTAEGRLCAVGNGQTNVTISCGKEQIICPVTVSIPPETEPTETEASSETQEELPQEPESRQADETEASENTAASQEATGIVLKLKQEDISFKKTGVVFQLELDCDLKPEEVTWLTMNSKVAICHDGLITVLGYGTTKIIAQYDGQEVYCIVRCSKE